LPRPIACPVIGTLYVSVAIAKRRPSERKPVV
jgi:hypothetical protein